MILEKMVPEKLTLLSHFCLPGCPLLCPRCSVSVSLHTSFFPSRLSSLLVFPPWSPSCLCLHSTCCPAVGGHGPTLSTTPEGGQHLHGPPEHQACSPANCHRGEPTPVVGWGLWAAGPFLFLAQPFWGLGPSQLLSSLRAPRSWRGAFGT